MKKKRKYTMVTPFQAMSKISKKLLFFGAFLLLSVSGYGQVISIVAISDGEEDGTVNTRFNVIRSGLTSNDVQVDYSISGTATPDGDFTAPSGTITIGAGGLSGTAEISILSIVDNILEGDESIIITLTNTSEGTIHLTQDTAIAVILDDDVSVEFSVASSSDNEDDGGNLPVLLLNGRVNGPTSVTVTDAGSGTATGGGVDYSFTSPTVVNIPADDYDGTLSTSIAIPSLAIVTDAIVENDETFDLVLSDPVPVDDVTLGAQTTTTYTIENDDTATLSITATTQAAEDNTDGLFTITTSNQFS
ncbi:Calx-beta domain-containing protein, partial [Maribacter polysiphoniae]